MGKSLYVQRLAEAISPSSIVCIPLHGPHVTTDAVFEHLKDPNNTGCTIFHIDVDPNVSTNVWFIMLFFSLILDNSSG